MAETSFRFPCYGRLKKTLGKLDAIVECTELAVRDFVARANADGQAALIKKLSAEHGIKVDHVQTQKMLVRLSQLHIVSVQQLAEQTFEQFRDEYPGSKEWRYDDTGDLLRNIIKNVLGNYDQGCKAIGTLEVELMGHYRIVRNRFAHTEIDEKRINKKAVELRPSVGQSPEYGKLAAPSEYDQMLFDDFILFTRALKETVRRLCVVGRPSDEAISEMVQDRDRKENAHINLRKLRRFSAGRIRNAIATILLRNYSLEKGEAAPIVERVVTGLLA